jgi:hypothetical protein
VLYSFIFLVTKGASSRVCETSFGEPIGCPTPILNSKPDEEFAAKGGPKSSTNSSMVQTELCRGKSLVRRFTSIGSRFG